MSKVVTFSRNFQRKHPRQYQSTFFVEQILNELFVSYKDRDYWDLLRLLNAKALSDGRLSITDLRVFQNSLSYDITAKKLHTIRAGHRFVAGDLFSPRVWSGIPYKAPQIIFYHDIKAAQTFSFDTDKWGSMFVEGKHKGYYGDIAKNDGLEPIDFLDWFGIKHGDAMDNKVFNGQMICWNDKIKY